MNTNTKLKLIVVLLLCNTGNAIGQVMTPFKITNTYGKILHVRILNPAGDVLQEQTPVNPGDNLSLATVPKVVEAFYPAIKDSKCGLVLKPEELKNKVVYLKVRPIRNKVRFVPLPGLKGNICLKSTRETKKAYEDWVEEKQSEKK